MTSAQGLLNDISRHNISAAVARGDLGTDAQVELEKIVQKFKINGHESVHFVTAQFFGSPCLVSIDVHKNNNLVKKIIFYYNGSTCISVYESP